MRFARLLPSALLAAAHLAAACAPPPPPPSVLLLTLDTVRADHLGCYGAEGNPTPELDALAARGTRFDHAIASASVTPVSHASILTGRSNPSHGLRVLSAAGGYRLPEGVPTLADVLAASGYRTAAVHSAFPVSSYFGLTRGVEALDQVDATLQPSEDGAHVDWDVDRFQRRSDDTTDRAIAALDQLPDPFFLWVHYWDPHDGKRRPPNSKAKGYVALYAEEVAWQDGQIGRLLDHLETSGRAASTVVVTVADHGQGLGDHGWSGHRTLHQEQIRVPLLVAAPGRTQVPVVEDLVRTMDILPTVLELCGIDAPAGVDGASLVDLLEGKDDAPRLAFADQINRFDQNAKMVEDRPTDDFLYCAMDADWKLIYRPTNPELSELYELGSDPREEHDLFHERPDQVLRLLTELAHHRPWVTEPFAPLEDADRGAALEALGALGYAAGSEEAAPFDVTWEWVCPDPEHAGATAAEGTCATCDRPRVPRSARDSG